MDGIFERIEQCDVGAKEILLDEGIDDLQTFMELDNNDFARLKLRTKVIKLIQRIQKELYDDTVIEERLEEYHEGDDHQEKYKDMTTEETESHEEDTLEGFNEYRGMILETVIDINLIFKRTPNGKAIMELLNEGQKPSDNCMSAIKRILCDYLKSVYGFRPSAYHKNLLAQSLVHTYPALSSSTPDVPQALWFHPNGRGKHRHSGRLHYHMEYLARTSGDRVINRRKLQAEEINVGGEVDVGPANPEQEVDMEAVTREFKFLCPGPNTKLRAEELWHLTFNEREDLRQKRTFYTYLEIYPVATAFNGSMISLEFHMMYPNAPDFQEKLEYLQPKLLSRYRDLFKHVKDDFIRMLIIIRQKSPIRGAKRTRDADPAKDNTVKGIVEWIKPEDPYPDTNEVPMLYVKGNFLESGSSAAVTWKRNNILMESDLKHCFRVLCESMVVFNSACHPTDKQFYTFISNVLLGIGQLTTTGERLMQSIE
ncbi:uncharacterized protein LOC135705098 [Ochlerotatus camptorhynchus]|uniref:uncharacterized protein LOC135705098 n=1 Tax=Ochlerotatus camptorhynchus TaxID=644619 RepID=UPI0031D2D20D